MTFWTHEPESEYHARAKRGECISSHGLAKYRKSPAIYKAWLDGRIADRDSDAYAIGRAAHCLILEGDGEFHRRWNVTDGPVNPKTGRAYGRDTNAYRDWLSEQPKDKQIIGTDEAIVVRLMAEAIWTHENAGHLLRVGAFVPEAVVRARIHAVYCQARIDAWRVESDNDHSCIVDLKTCEDVDYFPYDAKRYGYWRQLAFYSAVAKAANAPAHMIRMVAVEKNPPYRVGVYAITEMDMDTAIRGVKDDLAKLSASIEANNWTDAAREATVFCEL